MIINLTPHVIHLPNRNIEPEGTIARCEEVTDQAGTFDGIELIRRKYGMIENLPPVVPGTLYIVSLLVRQALPWRKDLASPGDLIRDNEGKIIGAKNLIINE